MLCDNAALATTQPARFYLPAYIGSRGWVALRLDVGNVDWDEVSELVIGRYRLVAPKRLGNCRMQIDDWKRRREPLPSINRQSKIVNRKLAIAGP
jgi:hypothetical protein